jgi:hypothetical protein
VYTNQWSIEERSGQKYQHNTAHWDLSVVWLAKKYSADSSSSSSFIVGQAPNFAVNAARFHQHSSKRQYGCNLGHRQLVMARKKRWPLNREFVTVTNPKSAFSDLERAMQKQNYNCTPVASTNGRVMVLWNSRRAYNAWPVVGSCQLCFVSSSTIKCATEPLKCSFLH